MNDLSPKRRPGRPSPDESEQKRRGMIVAALEEFARSGFHAASLRTIAEKAQVSSRTLYNHFPDKLALLEACLDYSGSRIHTDLPPLQGSLHNQLVTYAVEVQKQLFAPTSLQISKLIYRDGSDFDELRNIARTQFERYQVEPVVKVLRQAGFKGENLAGVARQYVVMAFGEWQRRLLFGGEPMSDEDMRVHAELVTGIFLNGIGGNLAERQP